MVRGRTRGLAILGGTFDHLHAGHRALLLAGLRAGTKLGVGITSPEFLRRYPKPHPNRIEPYGRRRRRVERFLRRYSRGTAFYTVPLNDRWGQSLGPDVEVLVASADTRRGAESVNRERARRGQRRIPVRYVPLVLGEDLLPISSRRIREDLIDREGRRKRPVKIAVMGGTPRVRAVVRRLFRKYAPTVRTSFVSGGQLRPPSMVRGRRARRAAWREAMDTLGIAEIGIAVSRPRKSVLHGVRDISVRDSSGEWQANRVDEPRSVGDWTSLLEARFRKRARMRRRSNPSARKGRPSQTFFP